MKAYKVLDGRINMFVKKSQMGRNAKILKEYDLSDELLKAEAKIEVGYIGGYELMRDGTQHEIYNKLIDFIDEYLFVEMVPSELKHFEEFLSAVENNNIDDMKDAVSGFIEVRYDDGGGSGWLEEFSILNKNNIENIVDIDFLKEKCQEEDLQTPLYQKICKLGEEAGEAQSAFLVYDNAKNKSGSTTKEAEEKGKELLLIEEVLDTILVAEDIIYKIQKMNNIDPDKIEDIKIRKYQKWLGKIQKEKK